MEYGKVVSVLVRGLTGLAGYRKATSRKVYSLSLELLLPCLVHSSLLPTAQ